MAISLEDTKKSLNATELDFYPEEIEVSPKGVAESAKYYQRLIGQIDLLDSEETQRLGYRIQLGQECQEAINYIKWAELPEDEDVKRWQEFVADGQEAKAKLITSNLRLVAYIARLTMGWVPWGHDRYELENGDEAEDEEVIHPKRPLKSIFKGSIVKDLSVFAGAPLSLEDRIQAGSEGLIRAAEKYNPTSKATFATYAWWWIESCIIRAIGEDRDIRLPPDMIDLLTKTVRAEDRLIKELGRQPTPSEIRESIGYRASAKYLQNVRNVQRLTPLHLLDERIYDRTDLSQEELVEQIMLEEEVDQLLGVFDENDKKDLRLRDILAMRFGLATGEPMTLRDIGIELDLTTESIRRLELDALIQLVSRTTERQKEVLRQLREDSLKKRVEEREKRKRQHRSLQIAAKIVRSAHAATAGSD